MLIRPPDRGLRDRDAAHGVRHEHDRLGLLGQDRPDPLDVGVERHVGDRRLVLAAAREVERLDVVPGGRHLRHQRLPAPRAVERTVDEDESRHACSLSRVERVLYHAMPGATGAQPARGYRRPPVPRAGGESHESRRVPWSARHPPRGRARAGRAAGQREGEGRLVRHLRHRPARVPRRADLHPAARQPPPDHGRDAPAPARPRVRGRGRRRRPGRRRDRDGRPRRDRAGLPLRHLHRVQGRPPQPVRAARVLRAHGRRRGDVGVRRHAVVHGPRTARRPDERAGRARRADRGRAAGGAPGRRARGRERGRVRRRPDRSRDRPVPARARRRPGDRRRGLAGAEGQGARDRRRRRHRPDRGGRRRPRARAHRRARARTIRSTRPGSRRPCRRRSARRARAGRSRSSRSGRARWRSTRTRSC